MEWNLFRRLSKARQLRIDNLEEKIGALERVRDEQTDINTRLKATAEDERRRLTHQNEDRVRELNNTIEKMERKAAMVDEELGHLVKIKESKLEITYQQKTVELERKKNEEIAAVKSQYQAKIEEHLEGRIEEQNEMYAELLARLPNIEVALKGKVG